MKTFLCILRNDIKLLISDWKMLLIIFTMPVLLIVYFSFSVYPILNKDAVLEPFSIGLVDKENSLQSRILAGQLKEVKLIDSIYNVSEEEAKTLITQNKIVAAIIIPEGFTPSVTTGENKSITVLGNARKEHQSLIIKNLMTSAAGIVSSGQAVLYSYYKFVKETGISQDTLTDEFNKLSEDVIIKSLARKEVISDIDTYPQTNLTTAEYYTSALFAVFLLFAAAPVSKLLVMERNLGITSRIAVTNAGAIKLISSKLLVSLMLSLTQLSVVVILTSTVIKNYWGANIFIIIEIFLAGIFAVCAWSLFVSVISSTLRDVEIISNLGILLMAVLGGSIYPLAKMPHFLKPFSVVTINRWVQEGFMMVFSGDKTPDISPQLHALIIMGIIYIALSLTAYKLRKVR